jgi:hypothetical protein
MALTTPIKGVVIEDGSAVCMARVQLDDGTNAQQADISAASYAVFNKATGEEVASSSSLTVANVVYDTLQTDSIWDEDSTGYNFKHTIAGSTLSSPSTVYRVEYKLTASGGTLWILFEITTVGVFTS